MSINRCFIDQTPEQIEKAFETLYRASDINLFWHFVFMLATVGIVLGGVQKGIESWSRVLLPVLFVVLGVLGIVISWSAWIALQVVQESVRLWVQRG